MSDLVERLEGRIPYRPANGFEGADFMASFCDRCERDEAFRQGTGDSCSIVADTMCLDTDEEGYPVEWRQDGPEGPRCTAFVRARQNTGEEG